MLRFNFVNLILSNNSREIKFTNLAKVCKTRENLSMRNFIYVHSLVYCLKRASLPLKFKCATTTGNEMVFKLHFGECEINFECVI